MSAHEEDDLVVREQLAIRIFENTGGYVVILQLGSGDPNYDDQLIQIRPENLAVVIAALRQHLPPPPEGENLLAFQPRDAS
jgi:hypothetical protein